MPTAGVVATRGGNLGGAAEAGPQPPEKARPPLPATVVIVPAGDTRRTRWLLTSAITTPPSGVTATAAGESSWAVVAGPPSPEKPGVPVPATVVIVPAGVTRRTRPLPASAITKPPSGVPATASTEASWAAGAGPPPPEGPGGPVPATVVMVPAGDTRRTRRLPESAIRKPPSAVAATASGALSAAAVAAPPSPENPGVPVPAAVVIVPAADTRRPRALSRSAISNPPSAVSVIPTGRLSSAPVANPPSPENPGAPTPATVKMSFVAAIAPCGKASPEHSSAASAPSRPQ